MTRRITVNARFLTQPLTGVQRVALETLRRMPPMTLFSPGPARAEFTGLEHHEHVVAPSVFPSIAWDQMVIPRVAAKSTLWSPTGLFPVRHPKGVMVIHDMAIIDRPEYYDPMYARLFGLVWPIAVKRAVHITTPSAFSRDRICERYGVPMERVTIVPLGVAPAWFDDGNQSQELVRAAGVDRPYVLAVGAVSARKNYTRLLEAWALAEGRLGDIDLVVVGRSGLKFSNVGAGFTAPRRVRYLPHVSDETLRALYAHAVAFLYPSLYEGFGLPLLEAMAAGTPVLTSNVTSMPEVSDGAALLVDPLSTESIADGIWRLCTDEGLRDELRAKGRARAAACTWERSAAMTLRVLEQVADG
ncbi:MAG TPA: glycosyltransferase family 1 protein [Gemmatimonadaceae bacterium]|nr:glycosyltransferase family 1 protein [Gemmatimonadaceae bacterium]